ncbi:MAG: hemolysin family protein [Pirellulaceae bacterium]
MWGVKLVVMLVMVLVNGIFAAYEIALASISLARLDTLEREHRRGAASAKRMKAGMEASLAVVQLGITLVGVIAGATGGAGAMETLLPLFQRGGWSAGWAQFLAVLCVTIPLTIVTIIIGELVPKVFALRHKQWVCLRLSPMMEWFAYSVWPVVWFLENSTYLIMRLGERRWRPGGDAGQPVEAALQELQAIAALARTSRLIGIREERIIVNAARIAHTPVRTAMLPAQHIAMLNVDGSMADSLVAAHADMHTRFPVTSRREDPQGIIGYVNFKDIVSSLRLARNEPSLRGILRPIISVQADMMIAECMERLIHEHQHIAVVRDAGGVLVGMITLEDLLEELTGEIHDEFDRLPGHISPSGSDWVAGGGVTLAHLREATGLDLTMVDSPKPISTLNEWMLYKLGRPANGGDIVRDEEHQLTAIVRKVRRNLVQEAHLIAESRRQPRPQPASSDG